MTEYAKSGMLLPNHANTMVVDTLAPCVAMSFLTWRVDEYELHIHDSYKIVKD